MDINTLCNASERYKKALNIFNISNLCEEFNIVHFYVGQKGGNFRSNIDGIGMFIPPGALPAKQHILFIGAKHSTRENGRIKITEIVTGPSHIRFKKPIQIYYKPSGASETLVFPVKYVERSETNLVEEPRWYYVEDKIWRKKGYIIIEKKQLSRERITLQTYIVDESTDL